VHFWGFSARLLDLTDAEYRGPTLRAYTFSRGALVLHDDLLWTLDLNLALALHAVCLCHSFQPPLTKICG